MLLLNTPAKLLALAFATIFGFLLGMAYAALGQASANAWLLILGIHSVLAVMVLLFLPVLWRAVPLTSPFTALRPAASLLLGVLAVSLVSRQFSSDLTSTAAIWDLKTLALVFGVPWAEEIVFRGGLGRVFDYYLGPWWGSYGSSLVFALAHGAGAWLSFGLPVLPLGPFLLGMLCSFTYRHTGRIIAPIALHSVCNATPLLFRWLDPRWLEWLQGLYLQV